MQQKKFSPLAILKKAHGAAGIFVLVLCYIVFSAKESGLASANSDGGVGAPGDGSTCVSCHSSTGSYNTAISFNIYQAGTTTPVTAYTAGTTYDITFAATAGAGTPGAYGFQLLALINSSNTQAGTWANWSSNVKETTTGSGGTLRRYIEHGVGGVPSALNNYTVQWTAPAAGSGAVKFYYGGVCTNNNGSNSGDDAQLGSTTITENVNTCQSNVTVTSNITNTNTTVEASNSITATNTVSFTSTFNVLYDAAAWIDLLPGFWANSAAASSFVATIGGGCSPVAKNSIATLSDLGTDFSLEQAVISPNPACSNIHATLMFAASENGTVEVAIYDMQGKYLGTLLNNETIQANQLHQLNIETSNLSKGTYLIRLTQNGTMQKTLKMVVL
ncbi:MAG: T9SS type A sorting domain-containing protein [Sphingobacteriales bacterium]|nr:T9SS type A sorting domain-containing protein [Sphingobacteriales bacterium]